MCNRSCDNRASFNTTGFKVCHTCFQKHTVLQGQGQLHPGFDTFLQEQLQQQQQQQEESEQQQRRVIEQRVGEKCDTLVEYVTRTMPLDAKTGALVTGNPLMLSMVMSIFESMTASSEHEGPIDPEETAARMPKTITELYRVAASAMLDRLEMKSRGGESSLEFRRARRAAGSKKSTFLPRLMRAASVSSMCWER